jgi:hypothetical protein
VRRLSVTLADARLGWIAAAGLLCFAVNTFFSRYLFWDSYLDLTGGRFVAQHGIPRHEALTTAAQRTWIDQQWLAHWTYYELWRLGGYPLVATVSSLLVASAFALLCALLVARKVPAQRAFLWTLAAFIACVGITVIRAQSFAYPLFVLLLWAILADARRQARVSCSSCRCWLSGPTSTARFCSRALSLSATRPLVLSWRHEHGC